MMSVNSDCPFSCLYVDVEKRRGHTLDLVLFFSFKAGTQRRRNKATRDQVWKQRTSAAFVQVLGLCCEIRGQLECAAHNLKLTSGFRQQRKIPFWAITFQSPLSKISPTDMVRVVMVGWWWCSVHFRVYAVVNYCHLVIWCSHTFLKLDFWNWIV